MDIKNLHIKKNKSITFLKCNIVGNILPYFFISLFFVSCSKDSSNEIIDDKKDNNEETNAGTVTDTDKNKDMTINYNPLDIDLYPYDIPLTDSIVSVDVNTSNERDFNNKQLALNCSFQPNTSINKGFDSQQSQNFVKWLNPIILRFPQGVWGNFYDWENDNRNRHGDTFNNGEFSKMCDNYPNFKYGINGLNLLQKQMHFNMLWIWSLNYLDKANAVGQLQDYIQRGFDVDDIELGNELFYKTQRATLTSTPTKILNRAKEFSTALKEEKSNLCFAIPIAWKNDGADAYNQVMTRDQSFYDALVIHLYYGSAAQNDDPGEAGTSQTTTSISKSGIMRMFTACNKYKYETRRISKKYSINKPFWLTEWGCTCGRNAASYLGMADTYLYFFVNPDIFEYVVWFQTHGLNPFFETAGTVGKPLYTMTGYGAVYKILESVFRDSKIIETNVSAAQFPGNESLIKETSKSFDNMAINIADYKVNSVNCLMSKQKDGTYSLMFVNKRNRPITVNLNIDGKSYIPNGKYEYLNFKSIKDNPVWEEQGQGTLNFGNILKEGTLIKNKIVLTSYSITKISGITLK